MTTSVDVIPATVRSAPADLFLRATRPLAVLLVSVTAGFVATAVTHGSSEVFPGQSPGSAFDASVIVFSVAAGWKTRRSWSLMLWGTTRGYAAIGYIGGVLAAFLVTAYVQGTLTNSTLNGSRTVLRPFLLLAVIGPIAETIMFRVGFKRRSNSAFVLLGVRSHSVAFWAVHLEWNAPLIVVVIALCVIRMHTRSLATVALAHAAVNMSIFAFSLVF
jgi:membrane protease YdiL (CAAX protease family)